MKVQGYKAFISYSHSDERWATWLHRALESYRLPNELVGTDTAIGKVPKWVRPVFRDRDDLSLASDLSTTVKQALSKSDNLIIICSPAAAASQWVNEEIREFVRLGKPANIFCVIVDGDPTAGDVTSQCFPEALAAAGMHEPLAADVRKWADGKYLTRLKLVAGMLGLPLDQLRRRELQKRRKIRALAIVATIVAIAILISAIMFQISAQQRRNSGETLVAVKLNELRTLLNVKEDPEDLAPLADWDTRALDKLITTGGDDQAELTTSAMDLRNKGIAQWKEGEMESAIANFKASWVLFADIYRRNRSDQNSFFELGQADYWIGQVHLDRGELDQADRFFIAYAEITRRLILLQPENDQWVLEMSYALTNLGGVQRSRGTSNPVRALQLMQSALEYNQLALVLDPGSAYYRSELGQSRANFADAQRDVCDLAGALASQQENITLQKGLLEEDPNSSIRKRRLASALSGYTRIQQMMGQMVGSRVRLQNSLRLMQAVLTKNPEDQKIRRGVLERKQRLVWMDSLKGDADLAWLASSAMSDNWQSLLQHNGSSDVRTVFAYSIYLLNRAGYAQARGQQAISKQLIEESMGYLVKLMAKLPDSRDLGNQLTLAAFQYWELTHELPSADILALLPQYQSDSGRVRACTDASMAARKAIMLNDLPKASELSQYLLGKAYRDVSFMRLCTKYKLCT